MCGIAGIVAFESRYAPSEELLRRMSVRIAHRGPDGEGVEIVRGPGETVAGLVHRRLAILDPDERSNQPFVAEHGGRRIWVTYNGEIYNYRELRPELEKLLPGFAWRTSGDTEVLAAAYLAWGEKCVERFLGMFAFAVFDVGEGTVFLARDRMGEKPLYFAMLPGTQGRGVGGVVFASELGAVTVVPGVDCAVDESSLGIFLALGYVPSPRSICRGVQKVAAAELVRVSASRPAISRHVYYHPATRNPAADASRTRSVVEAAVRSQLVSDVPLGCFLSGGVDSSIVALCASRAIGGGRSLQTFTARFDDPRYDESGYAEDVARHLGTTHRTFTVKPDAAEALPRLAASFGEPFGDSSCLPTYYLAKATRELGGVKVALSGDGGDELFAGYDRYRALVVSERLRFLPPVFSRWGRRLARGHPKSRLTRIGRLLASSGLSASERYMSYIRLFEQGMLGLSGRQIGGIAPIFILDDLVREAMKWDRHVYLEGDLLTKVDRAAMAVALEVRAPLLDPHVVDFASSFSGAQLLAKGPKTLLRDAFAADLPASVFSRRKMGFAVPIGEWFRGELRGMLNDLVLSPSAFCSRFERRELEMLINQHQSGEVDHSQRLFALVMLELWHRGR